MSGNFALGIGFSTRISILPPEQALKDFILMQMQNFAIQEFSAIATLKKQVTKKQVTPIFLPKLAADLGVGSLYFYDATQLEEQKFQLRRPSEYIYTCVGCHGVAEAAALYAAGVRGRLILEKTIFQNVTLAIAEGGNH